MSNAFYIPSLNLMGVGCLEEAVNAIKSHGFTKALIVTDKVLNELGAVSKLTSLLDSANVAAVVFDETKPNPTIENVNDGLALLKGNQCDCVISFGGGSPHDCAKGIALLATNGGEIKDYEGVDVSAKPQLPLISINTTAGTASEMTRFCIITDEARHIKMAIVDKNVTPIISVNDPELMLAKPASLTAATGMDALTHAIEAYVSIAATPVTDAVAIKAIEMVQANLREAVQNGDNLTARDNMAYAQFMAGMAFNNASLGYVHAIAHQLGGFYDLPHGVCNAILLPHVQQYNAKVVPARLADVARAMGVDTNGMTDEQAANAGLDAIRQLSKDVNIPAGLEQLGVKRDDFDVLAENALKDACGFTNPKQASHEEIVAILDSAL
ncbi:L-threonine dehydrogenase [Vibrio mediterranei]|uniref:L-threonine dehydrogenase n=1 Tax=Vibrio TaxID=662 RepID=UPI000D1845FA|nr:MULTISPECIES: L-threonine dehydrogenase [Vibrio]MDA0108473.1 L-threonine dehydrogenase [Vibrio sp. La 4.2.2]PTC04939.1 L-threonine dehydrogenase [Vibrio mediterranei]